MLNPQSRLSPRHLTSAGKSFDAAGTDTSPSFSPIDARFDEFVKRIGVSVHPDESGTARALEDLSDGQRSISSCDDRCDVGRREEDPCWQT